MNIMILKLNFTIMVEAVVPKLWCLDQYCHLHLGTCLKCILSDTILDLVSQQHWECFNKLSR